MGRDPEARGAQEVDQGVPLPAGDGADDHSADGEPVFDGEADDVSRSEAAGVGDVAERVVQALEDLPDHHEPDQDLDETEKGGQVAQAPVDEDDAERVEAHVGDPRQEDQERKDPVGVEGGIEKRWHVHEDYLSFSGGFVHGDENFRRGDYRGAGPLMLSLIACSSRPFGPRGAVS